MKYSLKAGIQPSVSTLYSSDDEQSKLLEFIFDWFEFRTDVLESNPNYQLEIIEIIKYYEKKDQVVPDNKLLNYSKSRNKVFCSQSCSQDYFCKMSNTKLILRNPYSYASVQCSLLRFIWNSKISANKTKILKVYEFLELRWSLEY